MNAGDSFWLATSVRETEHLGVVVAQREERVLIVNFTSIVANRRHGTRAIKNHSDVCLDGPPLDGRP